MTITTRWLDNDHLAASEATEITDNRSLSRMEEARASNTIEGQSIRFFSFYKYFITFVNSKHFVALRIEYLPVAPFKFRSVLFLHVNLGGSYTTCSFEVQNIKKTRLLP
jgi:hypothetical protein